MSTYNPERSNKIFIQEPASIIEEVKSVLSSIDFMDHNAVEETFKDTVKLFKGQFRGYQACKTKYHDLNHTLAVFLATARLVHGAVIDGRSISIDMIAIGLISALFHDAGLIQTEDEQDGTGAKFTLGHEERSITFIKKHLKQRHLYESYLDDCAHIIGCTIITLLPGDIPFRSEESELIGKIVGSADLLAQMADRLYLEKLLYLYKEFEEGQIPGFESEFDLLKKTGSFYEEVARKRLDIDLGSVWALMRIHFKDRLGMDRDFYHENIQKNIKYLQDVILKYEKEYRQMLKRAGIVSGLEKR